MGLFQIESYNLNLDRRERHWLNLRIGRIFLSLNQHRIPMTDLILTHWPRTEYAPNRYVLFGRIMIAF